MGLIQGVGTRSARHDDAERFWCDAFTNEFEVAAHGGLLGDVEEEAFPGAGLESDHEGVRGGREEEEECPSPGARHGAAAGVSAARRLAYGAARLRRARRLARVGFGAQERAAAVYAAACAVQRIRMTNFYGRAQRRACKKAGQAKKKGKTSVLQAAR